ncbi:MAG: AAA family ATPase [Candidatus Omnitrophota bacterium]
MYETYWGLKEKPFENTPDPKFMYYSSRHEEALARILYGIREGKGAVMLTGDYGSGKTVLSRIVINGLLKGKEYEVALLTHPYLTSAQLIQEIFYQLTGDYRKMPKAQMIHEFQNVIYKNFSANKRTVLIVDEAQIIKHKETFDELRLLLNFQHDDRFFVTLVLIGQPELRQKVATMPQLAQRLAVTYHLTGLGRDEVAKYVNHRLNVAGRASEIFTPSAVDAICDYSGGIPRKINNICDMALFMGFGSELKNIDIDFMKKVGDDMTMEIAQYAQNG